MAASIEDLIKVGCSNHRELQTDLAPSQPEWPSSRHLVVDLWLLVNPACSPTTYSEQLAIYLTILIPTDDFSNKNLNVFPPEIAGKGH